MSLLGLGILLIWEATGEGIDPAIGVRLSNELSSDCLIIFRFFILCWPNNPSDKKHQLVKRNMKGSAHLSNSGKELYHCFHQIQVDDCPISFLKDPSAFQNKRKLMATLGNTTQGQANLLGQSNGIKKQIDRAQKLLSIRAKHASMHKQMTIT